jgi:hypothetical protein
MYGYEYAEAEARSAAEAATHEVKCNGTLNRITGQIDHTAGPAACPLHRAAVVPLCPPCRTGDHANHQDEVMDHEPCRCPEMHPMWRVQP